MVEQKESNVMFWNASPVETCLLKEDNCALCLEQQDFEVLEVETD